MLIAFPELVTSFLDAEIVVDPNMEIIVPGDRRAIRWRTGIDQHGSDR